MASRNFLTSFGLPSAPQGPLVPRSLALSLRLPSAAAFLGLASNFTTRGLLSTQSVELVTGKNRQSTPPSEWNPVTGAGLDGLLGGQPVVLGALTGVMAVEVIHGLMGTLGIKDEKVAQALAGAVLHGVSNLLEKNYGKETAATFESQVPELTDWRSIAAKLLAGGGLPPALAFFLDDVRGQPRGSTGAPAVTDLLSLIDVCRKLKIDVTKVVEVGPIIFQFLKKKVDPAVLAKARAAHPVLAAAAEALELAQAALEAKKGKNDKKGGKKR